MTDIALCCAPPRMAPCLVRSVACLALGLWWWLRCAGLNVLSRGFFRLAVLHAHCLGVLYLGTLSARDVGSHSMPHWFAYCKSSRERRIGAPAGQYLGCACVILRVRPRQLSPGTARLVSHRLVSAEPHALAATCPLGHSLVFPHIRRKACLSR